MRSTRPAPRPAQHGFPLTTRREFLGRSLATTTLAAAGGAGFGVAGLGDAALAPFLASEGATASSARAAEEGDVKSGFIDAHVHVWTPDIKSYPLATGFTASDMKPPSFTPKQLFDHCRPTGVTRIVLIQMSFYGTDNRYMLDTIKAHPGVYSGVAVIDEDDPQVDAVMQRLAAQGVRGFRIRPGSRPRDSWLSGDGMQRMWKTAAKTGQSMCHLVDADSIPAIDRMCQKHPETSVVIDHFARIGADGQLRDADIKALCDLAKRKRVTVKTSAFYALGQKKPPYLDLVPMIRRLCEAYGADRLMWASDCPFQVDPGHNYADSVALVRDKLDFLSAAERDALLKKTAERVFFTA